MADFDTLQSPNNNYRKPTSSFFTSNRLFTSFVSKSFNEPEPIISPTSILDIKPFSPLKTPFSSNPITPKQEIKNLWEKSGCLGLIEALTDDNLGPNSSQPGTRTVLFGSQLKIQVSPTGSPKSPRDFGIKTMHSHVGPNSPNLRKSGNSGLSAIEMELSEDYTCVISYGPNPKTTHIFEDCIVDSCCGVVKFSESRNGLLENRSTSYPSDSFLSHCHGCKKNLGQGDDIYMYRGEKAFCSEECRLKEMMMMEWIESGEF